MIQSIIIKVFIIALGTVGLIINTLQSENIVESFSYYTTQSNLLIVIFFIYYLLKIILQKPISSKDTLIKGMLTVGIILTMTVYHFMLRPHLENSDPALYEVGSLRDCLMHYVVPSLVAIDWIIFGAKKHTHVKDPLIWCVQPILYLFYTIGYITLGGQYHYGDAYHTFPYFFLDYHTYGIGTVSLYALLILGIVVILGTALIAVQKAVRKTFLTRENY